MPTYEFRCPQGHEFEKFYRTISGAEAQAACPQCGKVSERMMSAAGFAFKGSGFYLTDYGKNAHRDKGTPAPANPGSGDGAKADATKAEGSKAEGSKAEGSKSEGSKAEGVKSDTGSPGTASSSGAAAPKPAADAKPSAPPPKKGTGE